MNESLLMHHRRVLTMQMQGAKEQGQEALSAAYEGLRNDVPGTPLPDGFPCRKKLLGAKYATLEDLDEVEPSELVSQGLSRREAQSVIEALERIRNA